MRMTGLVGFEEDIKPMFRSGDRDCMLANSFPTFDLWIWEQVRDNADKIDGRLKAGDMPPDAAWPQEWLDRFAAWQADGAPKRRGSAYADFFRDVDGNTEYEDLFHPELHGKYMGPVVNIIFPTVLTPWRDYAKAAPADVQAKRDALIAALQLTNVRDAVLLLDQLMMTLIKQHFAASDGTVDTAALLDAELAFGRDLLPLDPDRDAKVPAQDPRKPFAQFHRMDGAIMWFNWAAHLESSVLILGESDPDQPLRTVLMAGLCGGSSIDFTFRDGRMHTRPEYQRDDATAKLIRTRASAAAAGWAAASKDCHELFAIAAAPQSPHLAAVDEPGWSAP